MRQLSHHEQKLLKKVDFLQWKSTENVREVKVMRRYHIQKREDYIKYVHNRPKAKSQPAQRGYKPTRRDLTQIRHLFYLIRYNKLCGNIKALANKISLLPPQDPFRAKQEEALLEKLYNMGIITAQKQFSQTDKVTVSSFCRRRLPIVMCRLKMAETVKEAVTFVEQGRTYFLFQDGDMEIMDKDDKC